MRIAQLVVWLSALTIGGFGLAFTLRPVAMAALVEIPLASPTARIDFSATYGGFELGVASYLVICARRATWVRPGLMLSGSALAGFAAVRLLGILLEPRVQPLLYILLLAEVAGAFLSFWAANRPGVAPKASSSDS